MRTLEAAIQNSSVMCPQAQEELLYALVIKEREHHFKTQY